MAIKFDNGQQLSYHETRVAVRLFDANDVLVNTVTNKRYPAGHHQLNVDCSRLVKAVYFIRVERDNRMKR